MERLIQLEHVSKDFHKKSVLKNITEHLSPGEIIAILGPSGSGKSTLIRMIQGLESVTRGAISYAPKLERPGAMGMIFQNFHLFPHLSVRENITLAPRKVRGVSARDADALCLRLLNQVGLPRSYTDRLPAQLSGGEQQRVAIARSLAMEPNVLLCDEPTSALDPEKTAEVLEALKALKTDGRGLAMLVVTHEMAFAREVSDRVWFLDHGELVESSPTRAFFSCPQTPRARAFIERMG